LKQIDDILGKQVNDIKNPRENEIKIDPQEIKEN